MEVMYHLIDSHPSLWRERSATTAELVGFLHNVNYEARNMNEVCMFSRSERNGVATRSVWPVQWLDWTKRRLGLMALSLVLGQYWRHAARCCGLREIWCGVLSVSYTDCAMRL